MFRHITAELRKLRERREQLELPALDQAAVAALMDDFEQVTTSRSNERAFASPRASRPSKAIR